ncbi:MAG: APC family permease [Clostridia bacterium]|nr:APC family permease [Clostridia bacterium]
MEICNVCGKEIPENEVIKNVAEDGTEYYICKECNEGVEVSETTVFYLCKQCGYPHEKKNFKGICDFCEQSKHFEMLELTEVEADMLYDEPQKFYKEKLGEEAAKKIADWIESPMRKEVGIRHKRDRLIDTASLIGIIIAYILLEFTLGAYHTASKLKFATLLVITVMTLAASPMFKKADRKPRKKPLPLWSIYLILAVLVDIFVLVLKFA